MTTKTTKTRNVPLGPQWPATKVTIGKPKPAPAGLKVAKVAGTKRRGGGYLSERDAAKAWGRSVNAFRVAVKAGRAPAPMGKLGTRSYWYASQFGLGDPPQAGKNILTIVQVAHYIERSLRTAQDWVAGGLLPKPDGFIAAGAFWTLETVEKAALKRRGRGL